MFRLIRTGDDTIQEKAGEALYYEKDEIHPGHGFGILYRGAIYHKKTWNQEAIRRKIISPHYEKEGVANESDGTIVQNDDSRDEG